MIQYVNLNELVEKPLAGEWGDGIGNISVIRTANFTNSGWIDFSKVVTRNIPEKKVQAKKLIKGDIIIEKSGGSPAQPVGRVVFFDHQGVYLCNNFTAILRPITTKVHPKYLQYILYCNHKYKFVEKFQNKTTGIINLQLPKYLKGTRVPLPALTKQQKIAEILDAADALRQKDQQLIDHYTALSQSLFLDMFGDPSTNPMGWVINDLDSICQKITDGTHQSPIFYTEGIPFLLVSNIVDNEIVYKTHKYISEDDFIKLTKNTPIEVGDILYTSVGSYGNPAIVKSEKKFCFQRHIAQIKLHHEHVNVVFLHRLLLTSYVKRQADMLARGVAQKTLNLKAIKSFKIIIPPLSLQNQFASQIALIEKQKQQAEASLAQSNNLFNSLLQKAFTGELTQQSENVA